MIANATELDAALSQLASFADMLDALRMNAESKNDWSLFPLLSKGYLEHIRVLNTEIRGYLRDHPETAAAPTAAG
jgi:hypothetical protein